MEVPIGMCIPKPQSMEKYHVVRWGRSRGEEALVYSIPRKPGTKTTSMKRITVSAFEKAYRELIKNCEYTYSLFQRKLPETHKDGSCNFMNIGGIYELLGEAKYYEKGTYKRTKKKAG